MFKERIILSVAVDLDPVPGAFHTKESAIKHIQSMLLNSIPHYNPVVIDSEKADS